VRRIENHCCDCATPAYPCRGASCPNRNVVVYYCDRCKCEIAEDELFEVNGDDICLECLQEIFKKEYE
jgi:phage terminase large subunit GpA-like protein